MSLRSVVNLSKAASMAALSVLLSTTRKFFCASGPCVTCCGDLVSGCQRSKIKDQRRGPYANASQQQSCHGVLYTSPVSLVPYLYCQPLFPWLSRTSSPITARNCRSLKSAAVVVIVKG